MIKFTEFPPTPSSIEFAKGSGMTPEESESIGRLSDEAYMDTGACMYMF